ncbi:HD domain-containing protein [Methanolapillus millepedarum]
MNDLSAAQFQIIEHARDFMIQILDKESTSHDIGHVFRVEKNVIFLQKNEGGNIFLIRLAALLHDIGTQKENERGGDHAVYGSEMAFDFLKSEQQKYPDSISDAEISAVCDMILSHRFSSGKKPEKIEAQILQDADRLDALGAVGIFRSIYSMGSLRMLKSLTGIDKGQSKKTVYTKDPVEGFYAYMSYKPQEIPNRLNTETAKRIAKERLEFMELFEKQLREEND